MLIMRRLVFALVPIALLFAFSDAQRTRWKQKTVDYPHWVMTNWIKDWTYDHGFYGPANWYRVNKECGGSNQSPIDISLNGGSIIRYYRPLVWNMYDAIPTNVVITKNKHEVSVKYYYPFHKPHISGGPLNDVYEMDSLHFHWASNNFLGSEHTINNYYYPMEMHVIHINRKYKDFSTAAKFKDGLAVIAYLFYINSYINFTNPALDSIANHFHWMAKGDNIEMNLDNFYPVSNLVPQFNQNYVTYFGSLTTPPCSEAVTWIISTTPQIITPALISKFRTLHGNYNNFRPRQHLNGRSVNKPCPINWYRRR